MPKQKALERCRREKRRALRLILAPASKIIAVVKFEISGKHQCLRFSVERSEARNFFEICGILAARSHEVKAAALV